MGLAVSRNLDFAITVSADHLIGRYVLDVSRTPIPFGDDPTIKGQESSTDNPATSFQSKHAGNAAVSIRSDGRVCAVAGWDGKCVAVVGAFDPRSRGILTRVFVARIRLYSTKSFKSLGSLAYHREGCFCVAFSHPVEDGSCAPEDPSEALAMTKDELAQRARWLAAGSKDSRISIWQLFDPERAGTHSARGRV